MAANRVTGLNACFPALIRRRNPQPPSERGLEMFDSVTALGLARFQLAFPIYAHIIFPAFTIGLASYLPVPGGLWLWTRERRSIALFEYWKIIFAEFGRSTCRDRGCQK